VLGNAGICFLGSGRKRRFRWSFWVASGNKGETDNHGSDQPTNQREHHLFCANRGAANEVQPSPRSPPSPLPCRSPPPAPSLFARPFPERWPDIHVRGRQPTNSSHTTSSPTSSFFSALCQVGGAASSRTPLSLHAHNTTNKHDSTSTSTRVVVRTRNALCFVLFFFCPLSQAKCSRAIGLEVCHHL
jgi:hypothetical protein